MYPSQIYTHQMSSKMSHRYAKSQLSDEIKEAAQKGMVDKVKSDHSSTTWAVVALIACMALVKGLKWFFETYW